MKRHPGRRGMARLLAGRVVSTGRPPYRNPDRARLHPGKAAKKAARKFRRDESEALRYRRLYLAAGAEASQ